MAIPLIIPALFAAGSAAANTIGNRRAESARQDALAAERIRQSAIDRKSFALNEQSQDRYEDTQGQMDERSDSLAGMMREAVEARPEAAAPMTPTSDNVVVQQRNARSSADAGQRVDDRGDAMARFNSFGDLFGDIGRAQGRDALTLDQLAGFRRGSQGVLPLELEAAAQRGQGFRTMGDLLGLGAQATMGPALGGSAMPNPFKWGAK